MFVDMCGRKTNLLVLFMFMFLMLFVLLLFVTFVRLVRLTFTTCWVNDAD